MTVLDHAPQVAVVKDFAELAAFSTPGKLLRRGWRSHEDQPPKERWHFMHPPDLPLDFSAARSDTDHPGDVDAMSRPRINFDAKVLTLDSQPVEGQAVVK